MAKDQNLAYSQGLRWGEAGFVKSAQKSPQHGSNIPYGPKPMKDGARSKNIGGHMHPTSYKIAGTKRKG
jgi:hypothetical protein